VCGVVDNCMDAGLNLVSVIHQRIKKHTHKTTGFPLFFREHGSCPLNVPADSDCQ